MMDISLFAISAVVGCGIFYAASDFTRKKASLFCTPAMLLAITFSCVVPIYIVLFLMEDTHPISAPYILPGLGTVAANLVANLFFIRSVSVSPLSKTIPLLSLTPVLAAIISFTFLGEALLIQQWLGIFLVVLGILWLYLPEKSAFNFMSIWHNFSQEKGAKFMCIVAICWTISPIFDRVALRYTTVPTHALIHFSLISVLLWGWIFLRGGLKKHPFPKKEGWKIIALLSLLYAGAMGLQMLSLKMVYVGIMEAVKRVIGQVSAIIIGRIAFNEPITKPKIYGIILMGIGVPLIILT